MPKRKPARSRPPSKGRVSKRGTRRAAAAVKAGLSLRGFARRIGVNLWAVQKGIASGRLAKSVARGKRGRVSIGDVDLAVREWAENAAQPPPGPANGDGGFGSLSEAQRRLALERGRKLKFENLIREGRYVDRARVERDQFEASRVVRDRMEAVPDRISAQLAVESDAAAVHRILSDEIHVALLSLSESFGDDGGDAGAPGDDDGGDDDGE